MIPDNTLEKLYNYFDEHSYLVANKNDSAVLKETAKQGTADLTCILIQDSIVILEPEQNILPYLWDKNGAKQCADKFVYSFDDSGQCCLHVIEFKKTIDTSRMSKEKEQFVMGIYNARAIAAFLNFQFSDIVIHSGYRNDKISSIPEGNLIDIRRSNNTKVLRLIKEWSEDLWTLNLDGRSTALRHGKIQLDGEGAGTCTI